MADLSPVVGSERSGRRPVVVVNSPFYASFPIAVAIVVPLTTQDRGLPHHVSVSSAQSGLRRRSWARTDDVRAVPEQRLMGRPLGSVDDKEADDIRAYLRLMLDI
ncbi:type II toxin-antitoxin system PemK/MazF family toxin [Embleya scabrispora]|uniref:type II toxin-antitoxin system PemK/MazF family toxin n=1 Tax=Embleya scabrispora TaxID=159449 RepID=UPI0003A8FC87|nr:type II toxin-antitoxin system PemK/MazF family toxin [Embleya scabrispora]MYS83148.1 type II toxin-antitoxin system PemK/MazF family toxin [Streptomyces sp. SID5474]